MGQKVHPIGLRLGIIENWRSKWYGHKDFARFIGEDFEIRKYVHKRLKAAGISKLEIERAASRVKINIHSAKPGLIIGRRGKDIEDLRRDLNGLIRKDISLNIIEIRKPDLDAKLVGNNVAFQIERRVNYRRAVKDAIARTMRMGAEGVKIKVSGRLNGAEIARRETYKEGRIPLHTLRAEIDYALSEARTTYGVIGIKVWIFKGEKFSPGEEVPVEALQV
ncbi:MAG: 30S ribosomal protein S3 [Candidatus Dadabacteria bacterium]|nr:MAG: 30S ribosomal protein S3 [Candidatus Dadabacteria bacterium]